MGAFSAAIATLSSASSSGKLRSPYSRTAISTASLSSFSVSFVNWVGKISGEARQVLTFLPGAKP